MVKIGVAAAAIWPEIAQRYQAEPVAAGVIITASIPASGVPATAVVKSKSQPIVAAPLKKLSLQALRAPAWT